MFLVVVSLLASVKFDWSVPWLPWPYSCNWILDTSPIWTSNLIALERFWHTVFVYMAYTCIICNMNQLSDVYILILYLDLSVLLCYSTLQHSVISVDIFHLYFRNGCDSKVWGLCPESCWGAKWNDCKARINQLLEGYHVCSNRDSISSYPTSLSIYKILFNSFKVCSK